MVAALKKFVPEDFKGRFSAWWDGREYTGPDDEAMSDNDDADAPSEPKKNEPRKNTHISSPGASRIAALETLWGEGRFSPGSAELYARISEGLQSGDGNAEDHFGVLNTDPAMTAHFMGASGMAPVICEWRPACAEKFIEAMPDFEVMKGDIDRPPFEPGSLKLLVSQDAFAFADHKSGLAVRALRSLAPGGQWIVLDTVRGNTTKSLAPAFAASWAEPQLETAEHIVEVCEAAGFELSSSEDDVTGDVLQACKTAFARFGGHLEGKLAQNLEHVNKAVFVRELAWEAEAWKWRQRALAGELLHVKVWKFRKPNA